MGLIISDTDFVGKYEVVKTTFAQLGNVITQYERTYLNDLLGYELAGLFVANLTNKVPTDERFQNIYNVLVIETCGTEKVSEGMKNMMLGFMYWEFVRKDKNRHTVSGHVQNSNEISVPSGYADIGLRYNEAIDTYKIIQEYIEQNSSDYPEYKGKCKEKTIWLF